jgi:hypothetical protein
MVRISHERMQRIAPQGDYRIERLLPFEGGEFQYRLKPLGGGPERVVRESQIGDQPSVENLAQSLYESGTASGVPWVRRDRTVRDAWLAVARREIQARHDIEERADKAP